MMGNGRRRIGEAYVSRCLCGLVASPGVRRRRINRLPKLCRLTDSFSALRAGGEHASSAVRCPVCGQRPDQRRRRKAQANWQRLQRMFHDGAVTGHRWTTMLNQHYDSHEAYLTALAKALSNEYRAIHDAGIVLQIDAPDLAIEAEWFSRIWGKPNSSGSSNCISWRSIWGSRAFPASASGSMSAGATVTGRMFMTSRWRPSCPSCTAPMSGHSRSSSPIPGISTNTTHCVITRCRRTCC